MNETESQKSVCESGTAGMGVIFRDVNYATIHVNIN